MTHHLKWRISQQVFSTHILTRRMTIWSSSSDISRIFQLTSSQGGWPWMLQLMMCQKTFQLTSSQGGWLCVSFTAIHDCFFNSHPHKEDDQKKMQFKNGSWLFNSHPHKEDDPVGSMRYPLILFSTHILTRRMTVVVLDVGCRWTFQLTSSQGGWHQLHQQCCCQIFFQLTSSQGGWHDLAGVCGLRTTFQLTSSQGGWLFGRVCLFMGSIFQLTSSQGGWHWNQRMI